MLKEWLVEGHETGGSSPESASPVWRQVRMLDAVLGATGDRVYVFDRDGRCLFANEAGARASHRAPAEAIGRTWQELALPDAVSEVIDRFLDDVILRGKSAAGTVADSTAGEPGQVAYTLSALPATDGGVAAALLHLRAVALPGSGSGDPPGRRAASPAQRGAGDLAEHLQTTAAALSAASTVEEVADVIVMKGLAALGATRGVVAVLGEDARDLIVVEEGGLGADVFTRYRRVPITAPLPLAEAVRMRMPIWIESPAEWVARYPAHARLPEQAGRSAWLAVPLTIGERLIGSISFGFAEPRTFDADDRRFAQALAHCAALALDRTLLDETGERARAAAERERDLLRQVLDHAPIAIGVLEGPEHRLALANNAAVAFSGMPLDQMVGRSVAEIFPAEYEQYGHVLDRSYRDGTVEHIPDIPLRFPSGRRTFIDVTFAPLPGLPGKPTSVIFLVEDVTERVSAERDRDRLLAREKKLRGAAEAASRRANEILESIRDAFYALDDQMRLTYVNRRALELWHKRPEEVLGKKFGDLFPQVVGTSYEAELRRAIETGRPADFEVLSPILGIWIEVSAFPSPRGLSVYFRDISARKRAEEERERILRREQALARLASALVREVELPRVCDVAIEESLKALDVALVLIFLADPVHRELDLLAYRNVTPETAEEVRHMSYDAPFATARAARTERVQVVESAFSGPLTPTQRRIYERERIGSLLAVPLLARGHLVAVVIYGTHETRRFSAEDLDFVATIAGVVAVALENARLYGQVREALRLREEFMSAAAHELRTPVTVIKGRAQLMLRRAQSQRDRDDLDAILRHADRITRLVDNLLAASRVGPGPVAVERERFDLAALVRSRADAVARTSIHHRFTVDAAGPLVVDADPELIGNVIGQLIENALRYSPLGGSIELMASRRDHDAVVSVTDHGVGIPVERQPYAFEPFYELVPPGVPGYVGMATVGLYLGRHIVEAHGGKIWLASTPGKGSTFSFSLPLAPAEE